MLLVMCELNRRSPSISWDTVDRILEIPVKLEHSNSWSSQIG